MAALSLVKNVTKLLIGGGAVYITVDRGVWSTDTKQGSKILENVRTVLAPATTELAPKVPESEQKDENFLNTWNRGVTTVFGGIAETPRYTKEVLKSTKRLIVDK